METIQSTEIKVHPTLEENKLVGLTFEHMFIEKLNESGVYAQSTQDPENPFNHWKYFADATLPSWEGLSLLEFKSNRVQDFEDTAESTIKKIFKDGEKRARKAGVNKGLLWQYFRGVGAKAFSASDTTFLCVIGCYSVDSLQHLDSIKNDYEQAWKNYTHYVLFWCHSAKSGVYWTEILAKNFWKVLSTESNLEKVLSLLEDEYQFLENYYDLPKKCGLNLSDDRLAELRKLAEPKAQEYGCEWGDEVNQLWSDTIYIDSDSDQLEEVEHVEKWANHSENTKEALKNLKDQGGYTGGQPPIGWHVDDNGHEIPNDIEQSLINVVREYRAQSFSYSVIAAKLTFSDFTTRTGSGIFSKSMAKRINDAETIEERHERLFENNGYTYPIIDNGNVFSKQEVMHPENLKKIEDGIRNQVKLHHLSLDLGFRKTYLLGVITDKQSYRSKNWLTFKKWIINLIDEVDYEDKPTCTIHSIEAAQKEISKYKQTLTNVEKKLERQIKKHKAEQETVKEMVELHTKQRNEINDLKAELSNQETKQVDKTTALKLEAYQAEIKKLQTELEKTVEKQKHEIITYQTLVDEIKKALSVERDKNDYYECLVDNYKADLQARDQDQVQDISDDDDLKAELKHAYTMIHRYERIIDMIMDK
tara:strand:- start:140 stop:2077 length:1938 start_codon:yes stop_codon:yes gene_type:complete